MCEKLEQSRDGSVPSCVDLDLMIIQPTEYNAEAVSMFILGPETPEEQFDFNPGHHAGYPPYQVHR